MNSASALASGDGWSSQSPFFSKLGNYFDRPEWWQEGTETLKAFFDEDTPHADTTDQRLEDLLDLFEPLKVCKEPSTSSHAGADYSTSVEDTTNHSAYQQEQKHDLGDDDHQIVESSSNDIQLQAEIVNFSNVSLSIANPAQVDSAESEIAPVVANGSQNIHFTSENVGPLRSSSILDASINSDTVNTSSPLLTGATTSTRQTSPQGDSSNHASSTLADVAVSFDMSFYNEAIASSLSDTPKLGPSAHNVTADYRDVMSSKPTGTDNSSALTSLAALEENGTASTPFEQTHNSASNENYTTTETITAVSEDDPTGLQAVKDELSDEHDLPKAIDSSIISPDGDDTVVHDPSAAALSFFPPNPYSDDPLDFDFNAAQAPSTAPDLGLRENHEHIDDSSADSTLTSLASGDGQLLESQPANQLDKYERRTPSPPSFSPLTPPPDFIDTEQANVDVMDDVDAVAGDDRIPLETASTLHPLIPELGDIKTERRTCDDTSLRTNESSDVVNEVVDELADVEGVDGMKTSSNIPTPTNAKRKQEQPHADEPAQKRRLLTETGLASEEKTVKSRSRKPTPKYKDKMTFRPGPRDSPDELAPTSPDQLADCATSNPFDLSRNFQRPAKPKLAPLRKVRDVPRATRKGVGRKELAELVGAPQPETAAEKVEARLRSHSQTPAPASASDPAPVTQSTLTAKNIETNETYTPTLPKRKRPPGANPVSAQELEDLGNTPILDRRTRTRIATVEPTPEPITQSTVKAAPKRTKSAISNAEVERLGSVEVRESRTRKSTIEPTPEPAPVSAPSKRAKKPVAKPVARPGGKPSPLALPMKSKGTPGVSKKKAPPKKKAIASKQDKETPQMEMTAKRKRDKESEEVEEGAKRASKRIAGEQAEGQ
ncbi:hypothetical protein QM012_005330 [Aureobasidium pullulans]|uniref:Uncharacterized protein n=1 Tax=Aureobasidium pullulans TaxID=5580 RepID=A0ABR0T5E7_AURPU